MIIRLPRRLLGGPHPNAVRAHVLKKVTLLFEEKKRYRGERRL
jgi:hypothetical protein